MRSLPVQLPNVRMVEVDGVVESVVCRTDTRVSHVTTHALDILPIDSIKIGFKEFPWPAGVRAGVLEFLGRDRVGLGEPSEIADVNQSRPGLARFDSGGVGFSPTFGNWLPTATAERAPNSCSPISRRWGRPTSLWEPPERDTTASFRLDV